MTCQSTTVAVLLLLTCGLGNAQAQRTQHQVTGLFSTDREEDLRVTMEKLPGIKLISIDFKTATATFDYDAAAVFPKSKPDEIVKKFTIGDVPE